jgi:hypothetical protein
LKCIKGLYPGTKDVDGRGLKYKYIMFSPCLSVALVVH